MKNKYIMVLLISFSMILSIGFVNAIDISVENYYPSPVEAGDYFTIWLRITNHEDTSTEGSSVRLKQTYPFSLDPGEEDTVIINELGPNTGVTKSFKVRVDKEAKEGDNNLAFEYKDCSGCVWKERSMPITVIEFQTAFEVVLQEISSEGVFIAIANIGKNPANAVTVSIPEQDNFRTDLVSASIVGNLDSGDYTIAAFKILPKQMDSRETQELFVQIDYTDPFGVRRNVVKQILLNPSSLSRTGLGENGMQGRVISGQESKFYTNIWFWVSIVLIIFLLRKRIRKIYRKRRGLKYIS
ncbi:MAG: hypothetical protein ABIB47_04055 [Candidatus Woesearchaeota archaeon]